MTIKADGIALALGGRHCLYRLHDLDALAQANRRTSTSDCGTSRTAETN